MAAESLNIYSPVMYDESVINYEIHSYQPYNLTRFQNNDEICIAIQNQDLNILPSRSSLRIVGQISKKDGSPVARTWLTNNAIMFLFEKIAYKLNAVEIDCCRHVGLTTLMKGLVSFTNGQSNSLLNSGWMKYEDESDNATNTLINEAGKFDVNIPLSMILGFAEDYKKIVVNAKHELILTRTSSDADAVLQTAASDVYEPFKIQIDKIEWLMPHLELSNELKVKMLRQLEHNKPIAMSFRSWEMQEYPALPQSKEQVWTVKTSNQLEKPRFVIVGFQTNRRTNTNPSSRFDACKLSFVKLSLNSKCYPYTDMNVSSENNHWSQWYDMYANFQCAYYGKENSEPLLSRSQFKNYAPLTVIDCSKQSEYLKNATIDMKLKFSAGDNFPKNTAAYCLILHDTIVQYHPLSGEVKRTF